MIGCCLWMAGDVRSAGEEAGPANILFINADDLGWADAGFMGSAFYETPNLDRLASEGMVFSNAYAPAANCAPSRASVYTGWHIPRHRIFTVMRSDRGRPEHRRLIPTENTPYLPVGTLTMAAMLQEAGYATAHFGKWHVSDDPLDFGYEVNLGGGPNGHPPAGYFAPYGMPSLPDGPEGEYLTDRLGSEVIRFLEERDPERPFFVSLQLYSPHTPLQAKEERVAYFEARTPSALHDHAVYAAMVSHLDENVGRILDVLDELGLSASTLVLFTSDNGGIHEISRQAPLRGEKGSYYEGGIRVPMVVRWPERVEPGSRSDVPVIGTDFLPTFLEAGGVDAPEDHPLDGISLVPLFKGAGGPPPERALFWHFPVYLQPFRQGNAESRDPLFRTRPGSAIRQGRWKLIEYFEDGALELYDLEHDPGERRNLARLMPGKAEELHATLAAWREETGAPVPEEANPLFDAEAEEQALLRLHGGPGSESP